VLERSKPVARMVSASDCVRRIRIDIVRPAVKGNETAATDWLLHSQYLCFSDRCSCFCCCFFWRASRFSVRSRRSLSFRCSRAAADGAVQAVDAEVPRLASVARRPHRDGQSLEYDTNLGRPEGDFKMMDHLANSTMLQTGSHEQERVV